MHPAFAALTSLSPVFWQLPGFLYLLVIVKLKYNTKSEDHYSKIRKYNLKESG
jgi:hypothetical protein